MLAADKEARRALLHWGLCCPEAAEQLPPGHDVRTAHDHLSAPVQHLDSNEQHPFWTPFVVCMSFLIHMAATATSDTPDQVQLHSSMNKEVTPEVVRRVDSHSLGPLR
jgi:hypothetical protein